MAFEFQPLEKIAETAQITLPQQQISSWRLLDAVSKRLAYAFLERGLDISKNLDINEIAFKSPVETSSMTN